MNTRSILTILVAATLSAGLTTALAQQNGFGPEKGGGPGARGQQMFQQADTDGDGLLSEAELDAFRAERQAARAAEGRPMRNIDNAPTFADLDIDGDGYIAADELEVFHAERRATMGPGGGPGRGHGGHGPRGGGPGLQSFDSDGDGYLSEAEFIAAHEAQQAQRAGEGRPMRNQMDPAERFQELDSDGDGQLSLEEIQAGRRFGPGRGRS